jgi:hypothetical protein
MMLIEDAEWLTAACWPAVTMTTDDIRRHGDGDGESESEGMVVVALYSTIESGR